MSEIGIALVFMALTVIAALPFFILGMLFEGIANLMGEE